MKKRVVLAVFLTVLGLDVPAFPAGVARISELFKAASALPALRQIERIEELAAADRGARYLAVAVSAPELLVSRRAELEARLGPDHVAALTHAAVALHVEARGDERVMSALDGLARRIASDESWSEAFDGANEDPAFAPEQLTTALVFPVGVHGAASVHALTFRGGEILINGKRSERLRLRRQEGGLVSESFIHPDDSGLLVKVYHSGDSLAGFERKSAKIDSLAALSAAGAAPRLIEHGEAVVRGKGRFYFYVQELARGLKPAESDRVEFIEGASRMFARLLDAGLSLVVPGPDQGWLLSRLMLGKTAGDAAGPRRLYFLGGRVEPGERDAIAAHYKMLLSMLNAPFKDASALEAPAYSPASIERVSVLGENSGRSTLVIESSGKALEAILKRHQLAGYAGKANGSKRKTLRFDGERAALDAALRLIADPAVERIQVHPSVKAHIDRRGGAALYAMLKTLPESSQRDQLILKIAGTVYAGMTGDVIAAILALLHEPQKAYVDVPEQAWKGLGLPEAKRLVKELISLDKGAAAASFASKWIDVNGQANSKELLATLPEVVRSVSEILHAWTLLFDSPVLTPGARLDAVNKELSRRTSISPAELILIMKRLPRGINWGYRNNHEEHAKLFGRMKELGIGGNWSTDKFLQLDVVLLQKALRKTVATNADRELLDDEVPGLVEAILQSSKELQGKNADYLAQLRHLMFEELRLVRTSGK